MKHGFTFRLICLLIALATLPARSVAQTYEYVDDEGVHHVVHVVERDSDEDEVREYDTIRWRHNLRLTFGTLSYVQTALLNGELLSISKDTEAKRLPTTSEQLAKYRYYTTPTYMITPITVGYSYYIKRWLSVGGITTFTALYNEERNIANDEMLRANCTFAISAIANVRFEYMRRRYVQLYSAVGAGLVARFDDDSGIIIPMYDLTYFGIVVGKGVYGFAEVGAGLSGFVRAGIGYRF